MFVSEMSREECHGVVAAGDLAAGMLQGRPAPHRADYLRAPGNKLYSFSMLGQTGCAAAQSFAADCGVASMAGGKRGRNLPGAQGCQSALVFTLVPARRRPEWRDQRPQLYRNKSHLPRRDLRPSAHIFFCAEMHEITVRAACPGER